jgi:uncharacterized protein (TIGR03067 family)
MKRQLLAVLGVAALLTAGAGAQEKGKTDEEKFQGTWMFVSVERGGVDVMEDFVKEAKLTFTVDKIKMEFQGKEMQVSYKLDPAKKPAHIDITENSGGTLKGIYMFEGDNLKVCFAAPGEKRPTEFVTAGGSSEMLVVMKRDKK